MADFGTAAIGAGVALGAAAYGAASGFVGRHESVHSLQVTEIRRHITDFEAAYGRGEVTEKDWEIYQAIRTEARQKESEYEESISAYKETPTFLFVTKWDKKRQVRQKKKALQRANRSLRLHYYESTSDASDTSSVAAVSGSPPRSRKAHSDEDDKRILSWAEDVANSDSDASGLDAGPSSTAMHDTLLSRKAATVRQRMEADRRHDESHDTLKSLLRPPKPAPSAWQLYFTDWIQKQKASGTRKLNVAQASKEAGKEYASLSPTEKEPYKRRSMAMKEAREREHDAYMRSLTPEEIKRENLFRAAQRKAGKSRKSNIRDPNAPKKPLSAFFMFLQRIRTSPHLFADVFGDEEETAKQSVLALQKWRSMTDAERQPFLSQAEQEKMEYEAARRKYEDGTTGFSST